MGERLEAERIFALERMEYRHLIHQKMSLQRRQFVTSASAFSERPDMTGAPMREH